MLLSLYAIVLVPLSVVLLSNLRSNPTSDIYKIPNAHFTVPFTRLWLLWTRWNGRENRTRLELHRRLGSIVRIGPQEVSINCIEGGVRSVYGSEFAKNAWYPQTYFGVEYVLPLPFVYGSPVRLKPSRTPYMFTMRSKDQHTARKALLSALYTKSHVMHSSELTDCLTTVLNRFEQKMNSWTHTGAVDVLEQMRACMMDIITPWLYGSDNGTDFLRDNVTREKFLSSWRHAGGGLFWRSEFYGLTKIAENFGIHLVPNIANSSIRDVQHWGAKMTSNASSSYMSTGSNLYKHLRTNFENAHPATPQQDRDRIISAELLDHAIASHDVGGITLTYVMYELSKHRAIQQDMRVELRRLIRVDMHDDRALSQDIDDLPLLDAVVTETLRLHAPSPGPLPRVVPQHGCRLDDRFDVPPGTVVSATGYTLHRNRTVFPEPEVWQPARWLFADEVGQAEMRKWFWAFDSGARKCVAIHLAIRVIKVVLVKIYTDYETMLDDDHPLDQADATISGPISNSLYLRFCMCKQGENK